MVCKIQKAETMVSDPGTLLGEPHSTIYEHPKGFFGLPRELRDMVYDMVIGSFKKRPLNLCYRRSRIIGYDTNKYSACSNAIYTGPCDCVEQRQATLRDWKALRAVSSQFQQEVDSALCRISRVKLHSLPIVSYDTRKSDQELACHPPRGSLLKHLKALEFEYCPQNAPGRLHSLLHLKLDHLTGKWTWT